VEHSDSIFKETIMSRTMYEIARQLQTAGVQTTATFNPARLTTKLRNMVRRSIASGIHSGGWSSQTADIRKLVFELIGEKPTAFVTVQGNYISFDMPRPFPLDAEQEIFGLLEADTALTKMTFEEETRVGYYRNTRAEFNASMDDRLKTNKQRINEVGMASYSMIVANKGIREQIISVFVKQRTPEEVAIAERIASVLSKDEDIIIPTTRKF